MKVRNKFFFFLRVQVRWLAAKKIRLPCFRNPASGLSRGACKHDVGQSWSLRLRQFHIQVLPLPRPVGAEIVLGSESRLGFLALAWIHETGGDALGCYQEGE